MRELCVVGTKNKIEIPAGRRVDMYHIMQPSPGSVENPSTANVDCAPPRLALCDSSVQHRRCPEVPLSVCAFHLSMI